MVTQTFKHPILETDVPGKVKLARPVGIEPTTIGLEDRCSIH